MPDNVIGLVRIHAEAEVTKAEDKATEADNERKDQ